MSKKNEKVEKLSEEQLENCYELILELNVEKGPLNEFISSINKILQNVIYIHFNYDEN